MKDVTERRHPSLEDGVNSCPGIESPSGRESPDPEVSRMAAIAAALTAAYEAEKATKLRESKMRARAMREQLATGGSLASMKTGPAIDLSHLAPLPRRLEPVRSSATAALEGARSAVWEESEALRQRDEEELVRRKEQREKDGLAVPASLSSLVKEAERGATASASRAAEASRLAAARAERADAAQKMWAAPPSTGGLLDAIRARLAPAPIMTPLAQMPGHEGPTPHLSPASPKRLSPARQASTRLIPSPKGSGSSSPSSPASPGVGLSSLGHMDMHTLGHTGSSTRSISQLMSPHQAVHNLEPSTVGSSVTRVPLPLTATGLSPTGVEHNPRAVLSTAEAMMRNTINSAGLHSGLLARGHGEHVTTSGRFKFGGLSGTAGRREIAERHQATNFTSRTNEAVDTETMSGSHGIILQSAVPVYLPPALATPRIPPSFIPQPVQWGPLFGSTLSQTLRAARVQGPLSDAVLPSQVHSSWTEEVARPGPSLIPPTNTAVASQGPAVPTLPAATRDRNWSAHRRADAETEIARIRSAKSGKIVQLAEQVLARDHVVMEQLSRAAAQRSRLKELMSHMPDTRRRASSRR